MKQFLLLFCVAVIGYVVPVFAQSPEQIAKIEEIQSRGDDYYYAQSSPEYTSRKAMDAALEELARSIHSLITVDIVEQNDRYDSQMVVKAAAALNNIGKIEYVIEQNGERRHVAFVYISKAEYRKEMAAAEERVRQRLFSLIEEAQIQESKVNIAEALKYLNWALHLAKYNKINDRSELTDNRQVQPWLDDKIKSIIKNLNVTLATEEVGYDDLDFNHYTVNLCVTYADRPVSSLDISYFDNTENKVVAVKNGEAALKYPDLNGRKDVSVRILYAYSGEDDLEEDLVKAYSQMKPTDYSSINTKKIGIKVSKKMDVVKIDEKNNGTAIDYNVAEESASIPPQMKKLRKEVERTFLDNASEGAPYIKVMKDIEAALRSADYESVYSAFEPDALEKFQMMTNTGKISVSKTPDFKLEKSAQYIRGGRIPVSVANGKHMRNENIVLRFNPQTKKVSSIGYALTENAENDIFRDALWELESRYAMLKFMEDYQTAYTTKDIDYLDKVFNGNAIIVTGKVNGKTPASKKRGFMMDTNMNLGSHNVDGVIYTDFTKDAYLQHLEDRFRRNSYIYLVYHDAVISRAATAPDMNEAFWIRLKQDYNSSSYNDKGYLSLLIGVKPEGAQIYVRTWTPNPIDLDYLKKKYFFQNPATE